MNEETPLTKKVAHQLKKLIEPLYNNKVVVQYNFGGWEIFIPCPDGYSKRFKTVESAEDYIRIHQD